MTVRRLYSTAVNQQANERWTVVRDPYSRQWWAYQPAAGPSWDEQPADRMLPTQDEAVAYAWEQMRRGMAG